MIFTQEDKLDSYDDIMERAKMQIPLYCKDWTNFHPSDPGITILENLFAVQLNQQRQIASVSPEVQEKLLNMMNFRRQNNKCARVLLQTLNANEPFLIPVNQRFTLGDLSYECNRQVEIGGNKIIGLYSISKAGEIEDLSLILYDEMTVDRYPFGKDAKEGMEFYFCIENPIAQGEDAIFYIRQSHNEWRNPTVDRKFVNSFGEIKWEAYTDKGFAPITVHDYTGGMVASGELRIKQNAGTMQEYKFENGKMGYVIRGTLEKSNYDVVPVINGVYGFLFEVWQKSTESTCLTFAKEKEIQLYLDLLEEGYFRVYCKEKDGKYYEYTAGEIESGQRTFDVEHVGYGRFIFRFSNQIAAANDSIKIVAYNEKMMRHYKIGELYGFDDQEFDINIENVVKESFSLLVETEEPDHSFSYSFVKPDKNGEGVLNYSIDENVGHIVVHDAGNYINSTIYICGCAVTQGEKGNILAGKKFKPEGYDSDIVFTNPAPGEGGRAGETVKELSNRFLGDLRKPYTLVRERDYEKLVAEIPELCIKKVHAYKEENKNDIYVTLMPYSDKGCQGISNLYAEIITDYLQSRRMLTTRVSLVQPVYVPVDVHGTIYVKKNYKDCDGVIKNLLLKALDYVNGNQNFGETLSFHDLFHDIEKLDCVDFVYDFSITPRDRAHAKLSGMDIVPNPNALLVPGELFVDIETNIEE
ncbi:baseplate J/gp47 family protein [Pseudobutyrivibrio sp. MD2005]|uniref:baseplate J/gp47 family protein n=1 Tax=Pseudobutyrivibrio sp. MD2005 TaxID=1410616 RepID=UPI000480F79F|nr:baseplate J/gp47 family protein [Pseudobutyrivibrio sp. MD2005]